MNPLSIYFANNTPENDPILEMFLQAKENKDLALDFLNQEAMMEDLKKEFLNFYISSLNAVEDFFTKNLHPQTSNETSQNKTMDPAHDEVAKAPSNQSQNYNKLGVKRMRLSENEYVEKILMDFGYQDKGDIQNSVQSQRKTMEILDERIQIKLKNPQAKVNREFSPKILNSQKIKDVPVPTHDIQRTEALASATTIKDTKENKKIIDLDFLQGRQSMPRGEEFENGIEQASFVKLNGTPISKIQNENSSNAFNDEFERLKIRTPSVSKKSSNFRRSLVPQFEKINVDKERSEETKQSNEEKNSSTALEELISSIHHFKPPQTENVDLPKASTTTAQSTSQNQTQSILSNQVHQILYSKPMTMLDSDSEDDDDGDGGNNAKQPSDKNSAFYSFENPCIDQDDEDLSLEEEEQYRLTDYSDNSSSNEGSHIFHEEEESFDGPFHNQPMFNLFSQTQINLKENCPKCQNMSFDQCDMCSSQNSNSSTSSTKNVFLGSQFSTNENVSEYEYSQNTMVADYMYYIKQQNIKNNAQQGNEEFNPKANEFTGKKFSKLNNSPVKHKIKRLYCNDKKIPFWASNLTEIEKISKDQKKIFNSNCIFGYFNVDNLDLCDVFQRRDHRLIKPRGSSANWKNEPHTPSTAKPQNGKALNLMEMALSNTKKNIDFKSFF